MSLLHCLAACAVCFGTGYAVRGFVRRELAAGKAAAEKVLADVKAKL